MRRLARVIMAAVLAALAFIPLASGSKGAGHNLNFRFLWPADPGRPGEGLVELKIKKSDVSMTKTPVGSSESSLLILDLPSGELAAECRFLELKGKDGVYIFETEIKQEIPAPTGDYFKPHFALPAITPPKEYTNVLTYTVDAFSPPTDKAVATTGPVILYSDDLEVIVISPLDNFMEAMTAPVDGEWHCGFGGMIERVPAGTVHKVLVVTGRGINNTMRKWGDIIRAWHNHQPASLYADVGVSYLGYYTDNGAYYYYKDAPGMNYHQTLIAVKEDADRRHIPFGYFQIDSWWYPKAKTNDLLSMATGGALLWEPMPELFPQGLAAFQEELSLPLVAHNRWYDKNSPYCRRYQCVEGGGVKNASLPVDPVFWDEIMDNAVSYGVEVYEQDWLVTQMNFIPWLRSGLGNAANWFDAMARAAADRGLTMQLCMASPEFFLQQMKHDNVTHVRCSGDYMAGVLKTYYWPKFHKTSMFASAVGLMPFKDNFQSAAGQRTIRNERWAFEEALISNLSAGPVGPSDKIGAADQKLLMRTCREDGLLLKPDRPATPIDLMFLENEKPWMVTTESEHATGRSIYLAAFNLWPLRMRDPSVSLSELGCSGKYLAYDWRLRQVVLDPEVISFGKMPRRDAFYYVLCPVLANGMAVIGEADKFLTVSKKRFSNIEYEGGVLSLDIEGVPGEEVLVSFFSQAPPDKVLGAEMIEPGPGLMKVRVVIPETGRACVRLE